MNLFDRLLIALTLFLVPALAQAQCNGIFQANKVCGTLTGGVPSQQSPAAFQGSAGGTNGQIQYNNSGALAGFTMSQDCTTNTSTGVITCLKTNNVPFGSLATQNSVLGSQLPSPFTSGTASGNTSEFGTISGSATSGDCVQFDANGNLISAGSACSVPGFNGNSICNLQTAMDNHYGVGDWTHYTGVGTGTDIGPAMSDCITAFASDSSGVGTIYVPATGGWMLRTNGIDFSGISIIGDYSSSTIYYNPTTPNTVAFAWRATNGRTGGGIQNIAIVLDSGLGTTGDTALLFQGNATYQPDESVVRHVYMTSVGGSSSWNTCLLYNGIARTSPQGIRVATISDVQLFGCNNIGASFTNVVQFSISNLGIYVSSGTGENFVLTGGGTTLTDSTQVYVTALASSNDITINNSTRFFVWGTGATVTTDTTATHGVVWAAGASAVGTCGTGCTINTF